MDRKITFSVGAGSNAKVKRTLIRTWAEFVEGAIREVPVTADKASAGWICGAEFKPAYRDSENFVARHLLSFDYDHITPQQFDAILAHFAERAHLAYTTWSHTPDRPRLRVWLPLSRPCTYDEFQAVSRSVAASFDIEAMARESHVPAQYMFRPTQKVAGAFKHWENLTGEWVDVDATLAAFANWTDRNQWPRRRDGDGVHTRDALCSPLEKPGIVGAFCRAFRVSEAIERFDLPYKPTRTEGRWTYTQGSRPEGAIVYDDDTKLHSHHDTDPAHGQSNAFDLVRAHRFTLYETQEDREKPITERPSYKYMVAFALEQPEVQAQLKLESAELCKSEFSDLDSDPEDTSWLDVAPPAPPAAKKPTVHLRYDRESPIRDLMDPLRRFLLREGPELGLVVFGNRLVRPLESPAVGIAPGEEVPTLGLVAPSQNTLIELIGHRVEFFRDGGKVPVITDCPVPVAQALASDVHAIKALAIKGVSETPILRHGKLHTATGFDPLCRVWFNSPDVTLPSPCDQGAAAGALAYLDSWLEEFRFANEVSHSVALAAILTAAVRSSLAHAPGFIFSKPSFGAGASTLCNLVHIVLTGRRAAVINPSKEVREMEKQIEAAQARGRAALVLDNVTEGTVLNSTSIAQLLTEPKSEFRLLGAHQVVEVPNSQLVLMNGVNVSVRDDLGRRCLLCEIDPAVENPENRTFKRPALLEEAQRERRRILEACFTIITACLQSGARPTGVALAGFTQWASLVQAPLLWLGRPDPVASQERVRAEDPTKARLSGLYAAWFALFGDAAVSVTQVLRAADSSIFDDDKAQVIEALEHALEELAPEGRALTATRLGIYLHGKRDRVVDGLALRCERDAHTKTRLWRIVRVSK